MARYRQLTAWSGAHALVVDVYRSTTNFPDQERFALTRQIRRAAVSIPANLAEGTGRQSDRELAHHARIARGSLYELQYLLMLARDLGYLDDAEWERLNLGVDGVGRPLWGLLTRLSPQPLALSPQPSALSCLPADGIPPGRRHR